MFDPILVSEPAELPISPIRPRVGQNTLLAAVVGVMFAVGVVLLVEYLDNTVKTPEDIQRTTGSGVLCAIPLDQSDPSEITSAAQPRSPVAEAYRVLRTNIQLRTIDTPVRTILVTSSTPYEGKSTVAANLGVVMAQAGLQTIVVDTDLRRPTLHTQFNLPAQSAGVTKALLAEGFELEEQLQVTGSQGLRVLTSGPLPPNPSELLGSARMKELVEALKQQAEVIIFDSPPMLGMADAAVLANIVEGVLVVAGAGEVRHGSVSQSITALHDIDADLLGIVLTKFKPPKTNDYYYYQERGRRGGRGKG